MNLFRGVLGLHILSGTVALAIAPMAMMTVKGGRWHRRWGKIYFWAMAGVALSATLMCWLRSGLFLFLIAVFSFYLAITGYRVLGRKKPENKPHWLDRLAAVAVALAGCGLIVSGLMGESGNPRVVKCVFGGISLFLGTMNFGRFLKPPRGEKAWMLDRMTRFLSAYIATVTAFSVVNFQFLPYLWRWLWPTVLGVIGINLWRRYYKRRLKIGNYGIAQ